jgi:4-hydroxy-4-methyl-2-oxoglutarate aldolase
LKLSAGGAAVAVATPTAANAASPEVPALNDTSQKFARHKVNARIERVPTAVIDGLRAIPREVVTEHVGRSQIVDTAIKPLLGRDWSVVGSAVTVDLDALDHLMCIAAIGVAQPGDVIVIAARGLMELGVWGGGLTLSAKTIGVEAVAVDGAVLDSRAILQTGVPVFCRGSHPAHGTRERPGSVNVPVSFGGVLVNPGDVILGDLDGVIIVRREAAADVLASCQAKTEALGRNAKAMSGVTPRTFFDLIGGPDTIRRAGVEWIG